MRSILLAGVLAMSCTFAPCLNRQCVSSSADASGDFAHDLVGQWVSTEAGDFVEYRANGTGHRVTVCDNGNPGVIPGAEAEFSYVLDGGTLTQGLQAREVLSLTGTELVVHELVEYGATVHYARSTCTGAPF